MPTQPNPHNPPDPQHQQFHTINTPLNQVYELFNKVLILSQGETVYFGGTKQILHWFEKSLHRCVPACVGIGKVDAVAI